MPPDALFTQGQRQRTSGIERLAHAPQRPDILGQCIQHHDFAFAFGLQAVEHALHPLQAPAQHRLPKLEDVIAGHIEHGRLDLRSV